MNFWMLLVDFRRRGESELNFVVSRYNMKELNTTYTANIFKVNDAFKSTNFENNLALLCCKVGY